MNGLTLADYGRRIEFCCDICLFAAYGFDDDPVPCCPRGHRKMTAPPYRPRQLKVRIVLALPNQPQPAHTTPLTAMPF